MFSVDGRPARFLFELYDRIQTRNGFRLTHFAVYEPVNRRPFEPNLFVPSGEEDRVYRLLDERDEHLDEECPCGCGNYDDGSPPKGQAERNPCVYDTAYQKWGGE